VDQLSNYKRVRGYQQSEHSLRLVDYSLYAAAIGVHPTFNLPTPKIITNIIVIIFVCGFKYPINHDILSQEPAGNGVSGNIIT
jgi:hypothetical protein